MLRLHYRLENFRKMLYNKSLIKVKLAMYIAAVISGFFLGTVDLIAGVSWPALFFYCPLAYLYSKISVQKVYYINRLGILGFLCEGTRILLKILYAHLTYQTFRNITLVSPVHALILTAISITGITMNAFFLRRKPTKEKEDPPPLPSKETPPPAIYIESSSPDPPNPSTSPITCPSLVNFF